MIATAIGTSAEREVLSPIQMELREEVASLETHVREKLMGRLHLFQIHVGDRGLVLWGRAPSFYVKSLAQHAVMERTQIPIEWNHIEVHCPATQH